MTLPSPLQNFGTVAFTHGELDGQTVGAAGAVPYDMISAEGTRQIITSRLNAEGTSWKEVFRHG